MIENLKLEVDDNYKASFKSSSKARLACYPNANVVAWTVFAHMDNFNFDFKILAI
jgi:hypothetical protein